MSCVSTILLFEFNILKKINFSFLFFVHLFSELKWIWLSSINIINKAFCVFINNMQFFVVVFGYFKTFLTYQTRKLLENIWWLLLFILFRCKHSVIKVSYFYSYKLHIILILMYICTELVNSLLLLNLKTCVSEN